MAHILRKRVVAGGELVEWVSVRLARPQFVLRSSHGNVTSSSAVAAMILARGATSQWAVLGGADLRVNSAASLGIRVLRDRDEIRLASGEQIFFSTENPARVEPFAGDTVRCPRCSLDITPQQPAVRCPQCGIWHHQDPVTELPCWSFTARCSRCPQSTALDSSARWSPQVL